MVQLSMDDVNLLWEETPHRNWSALHDTLEQERSLAMGVSDDLMDALLAVTDHCARLGQPYPESSEKLYELLNQEIRARA